MNHPRIQEFVTKYFEFLQRSNGLEYIEEIMPPSMIDHEQRSPEEGICAWKPIPSSVTASELIELERFFGHELPSSYKHFLQYSHFIEFDPQGVRFFPSLPDQTVDDIKRIIDDDLATLVKRNYLPFAHLSDHGVVCFDANEPALSAEYPIVAFDHEDGYDHPETYASDFTKLFDVFDRWLDQWIMNRAQM